jgi:hypothetical protein
MKSINKTSEHGILVGSRLGLMGIVGRLWRIVTADNQQPKSGTRNAFIHGAILVAALWVGTALQPAHASWGSFWPYPMPCEPDPWYYPVPCWPYPVPCVPDPWYYPVPCTPDPIPDPVPDPWYYPVPDPWSNPDPNPWSNQELVW